MHIAKLHLRGFKSFPNPTDVSIGPGVTAVVGPNGCGKSNLLEALRWTMGETSYKNMRGSEMEDVVFAGSPNSPQHEFAETRITFHNPQHTAPQPWTNLDAIEVSRRIERGSGSFYRINGNEVRARDVRLLFADAGAGARSASLIQQGKVAALINAKPQERRAALEEAAGVAGLRARRHDASLRLRAARDNLDKIDALAAQHETRLRSLRRQARQAAEHDKLSSEITRLHILNALLSWRDAQDSLKRAQSDADVAGQNAVALQKLAANADADEQNDRQTLPPLREELSRADSLVAETLAQHNDIQRQINDAAQRRERLQTQLSQTNDDVVEAKAHLADCLQQLTLAEKALGELPDDDALDARLADARSRFKTAQQNADDAVSQLNDALLLKARYNDAVNARSLALKNAGDEAAKAETAFKSAETLAVKSQKTRNDALKTADAAQRKNNDADKALLNAQSLLDELNSKRSLAQDAAHAAQRNHDAAQQRLNALEITLQIPKDPNNPGLRAVDLLTPRRGYETALAAALGAALGAVVNPKQPKNVAASWLPPQNPVAPQSPLPKSFPPLSKFVPNAPDALALALNQIGVAPNADALTPKARRSLAPGQSLVAKDGTLLRWDGYHAKPLASRRHAELAQLRADIPSLNKIALNSQNALNDVSLRLNNLQRSLPTLRSRLDKARSALSSALSNLKHAEQNHAQDSASLTAASSQRQLAQQALKAVPAKPQAPTSRNDHAPNAKKAQETLESARTELLRLEAQQQHAASLRKDLLSRRNERADASQNTKNRLKTLQNRLADIQLALKNDAETPPPSNKSTARSLKNAQSQRQVAADKLQKAESILNNASKSAKTAHNNLADARETRAAAAAVLNAAQNNLNSVHSRILEEHNTEPQKLRSLLSQDDVVPDQSHKNVLLRISKLQQRRDAMGPLNLAAHADAEELNKELTSLKTSQTDLNDAHAKLSRAVNELNREARSRMNSAFNDLNIRFQSLFKTLFNGGNAKLLLVDSHDPMEAGLDIVAQPPRKKAQPLSLLSGGEQVLTTLALVFAVFLVKPAPICVLDEADAPLDDANVERFCNLLHAIARETSARFLVITHHPLTMARADRLYGVTMTSPGSSSLVSVDLQTAEKIAEKSPAKAA